MKALLVAGGGLGIIPLYRSGLKPALTTIGRGLAREFIGAHYATAEALEVFRDETRQQFHELREFMQTYSGHRELDQNRLATLETKIGLFWKMIETSTADLLHRDDTPQIDVLLEELRDGVLSSDRREVLKRYLEEIERDHDRPRADRYGAVLLRASLIARYDA